MLTMNNIEDIQKMRNQYRTSDMINLLIYFPEISPIRNLTIIEDEEDYLNNIDYIQTLDSIRVDSLKERPLITGIESTGKKDDFFNTLKRIKKRTHKVYWYYLMLKTYLVKDMNVMLVFL